MEKFYTIKQVMEKTGKGRQTVRNMLQTKGVNYTRTCDSDQGHILIPSSELPKLFAPTT